MSLVSLLYKPVLLVCLLFATVAVSRRFCDKEDGICPDTPESTMSAKEFVDAKIKTGPVVVFSKTYCPYCHSTKKLFKDLGVAIIVVELDERDDGAAIQDYLQKLTGGRSVSCLFVPLCRRLCPFIRRMNFRRS